MTSGSIQIPVGRMKVNVSSLFHNSRKVTNAFNSRAVVLIFVNKNKPGFYFYAILHKTKQLKVC